jgi:ATP-dependent exoDNAse (exonuclease V) beta subunit
MSRIIDPATSRKLWELEQRFPETNTLNVIESLVAKARANGLDSTALAQCESRSAAEFLKFFGPVKGSAVLLNRDLATALDDFLQRVDLEADTTDGTEKAVSKVRELKNSISLQSQLPWSEWHRPSKLKPGKKSLGLIAPVIAAAVRHDHHPELHADVTRLIHLVFFLAAKTLDAYQEYKREWGIVDFIDQEALMLKLLDQEQVVKILGERLDLVLVDEFQDTSPIQLAIFLKLARLAKKSVWVGDQKQAIYGFRDADPALMDAAISGILQGKEPETLQKSWRSRPALVHSTSAIFTKAFAKQGFPIKRVWLKPSMKMTKDPLGLSPIYECWELESKNKENDAKSLASVVRDYLADPANSIRDPKTGEKRSVKGGDIAILCRENEVCVGVATALEEQGVEAAIPRPGLLDCPEVILTLAAVHLLIDPKDSLARAEIARLLDNPSDSDAWLHKALRAHYGQGFDLEVFCLLEEARKTLDIAGPLPILDAAMETMQIRQHCLAWGQSNGRLANLDSLRTLCVSYVEECRNNGRGASPAGMLAHLQGLESATRAVVQDENAVQVLTWHKAKGLEWPVTILFQLDKVYPPSPLGVQVVNDAQFTLDDPLANRWLRYWPNPYGKFSAETPFHDRLKKHPAQVACTDKEERQELRLLYVGWTRARDKVILAGRKGFLQKGILRLLTNSSQAYLLEAPPQEEVPVTVCWAGQQVTIRTRSEKPGVPLQKGILPGCGYEAVGPKNHPPAFLSASGLSGQGTVTYTDVIGKRIPLAGQPDMQMVGEAIHTFLAADSSKRDKGKRMTMATATLTRWKVTNNLTAEALLTASDRLRCWVDTRWPQAVWHHEYPVALRQANGTIVSGFIDLLLKTPDGFVVVDHKSFPGSREDAEKKAASFAGQLGCYRDTVLKAIGKEVIGSYIHLPITGIIVCVL